MNPVSLILQQLRLEGIGIDDSGHLMRIQAPSVDDIPRVCATRHADGFTRYLRHDLPSAIRDKLETMTAESSYADRAMVRQILTKHAPSVDVWLGSSYVLPTAPSKGDFPDVTRLGESDRQLVERFDRGFLAFARPIYAVVVAGEIVSACVSVREDADSAEAWVQTVPAFRRRGFARQVTAAWARDVRSGGKTAFYSHAWDNVASEGIARGLGMIKFVDAVGYL